MLTLDEIMSAIKYQLDRRDFMGQQQEIVLSRDQAKDLLTYMMVYASKSKKPKVREMK